MKFFKKLFDKKRDKGEKGDKTGKKEKFGAEKKWPEKKKTVLAARQDNKKKEIFKIYRKPPPFSAGTL